MIRKYIKIIFAVGVLLAVLVFASACAAEEVPDNNVDPHDGRAFFIVDENDPNSIKVYGRVRDGYFDIYPDFNVYFESIPNKPEPVAVTDKDGLFSFCVRANIAGLDYDDIMDFVFIDSRYDFVVTRGDIGQPGSFFIDVVFCEKGTNPNIFNLIDIGGKVTFHESGLKLPEGYYSRDHIVSETVQGSTNMRGVEFYVNGNLVWTSHRYGIELRGILPGSVVEVRKEGFDFLVLTADGVIPLAAQVSPDSPPIPNAFIAADTVVNIRATLKEGYAMEDLDL